MFGTLISSVTVGAGGASSISFSSIPGTYTDLCVVLSARSTNTSQTISIDINALGAGNLTVRFLRGTGSAADSVTSTNNAGYASISTDTASTYANGIYYFPNYAGSTAKTYSYEVVSENNATAARQMLGAGLGSNTGAITTLTFAIPGGNFEQYSTAYLYGTLKGSGGATAS